MSLDTSNQASNNSARATTTLPHPVPCIHSCLPLSWPIQSLLHSGAEVTCLMYKPFCVFPSLKAIKWLPILEKNSNPWQGPLSLHVNMASASFSTPPILLSPVLCLALILACFPQKCQTLCHPRAFPLPFSSAQNIILQLCPEYYSSTLPPHWGSS